MKIKIFFIVISLFLLSGCNDTSTDESVPVVEDIEISTPDKFDDFIESNNGEITEKQNVTVELNKDESLKLTNKDLVVKGDLVIKSI